MAQAFPENIPGIRLLREEGAWKYIDVKAGLTAEAAQQLLQELPDDRELCFFEYRDGDQVSDWTGVYVMVQTWQGMCYYWKGSRGGAEPLARMRFAEMADLILQNVGQPDAFLYIVPQKQRFEDRGDFRWHVAPPRAYDDQAELLRHLLATIAFRFQRAVRDTPTDYWHFEAGNGVRKPVEILNHMRNVLEFARAYLTEEPREEQDLLPYDREVTAFHAVLARLDEVLVGHAPAEGAFKKFLQGPFTDVLTHVGQLAMLRRMHGEPVKGMSYVRAEIRTGNVGIEQLLPEE